MSAIPHEPSERVWDPLVRLTHWAIALAILLNGFIIDEDALAHIWIGYAALSLLALRLLWGLIGSENARFSSFPISFTGAARHVSDLMRGQHPRYASHNPLGALMVYALWGTLLAVSVTGVMLESDLFPESEAEYSSQFEEEHETDDDGEDGDDLIEQIHEGAANFLLFLAALHVGGVILESRLSGRNLVRAMITGRRS
jgi:cytochrome b